MRRICIVLLTGLFIISLSACGGGGTGSGAGGYSSADPLPGGQQSENEDESSWENEDDDENEDNDQTASGQNDDEESEQQNNSTGKNLLPFLVFYSVSHMEIMNDGIMIIDEDEYLGSGEPGYDYFEWHHNDSDGGWFGISIDASSTLVGDNQKIDEGEVIIDLNSYSIELGCSYGTYKLDGIVSCNSEVTTNIETDDWQVVEECTTDGILLQAISQEGTTDTAQIDVLITETGNGYDTDMFSISGNYLWDGQQIDLDALAHEAVNQGCINF